MNLKTLLSNLTKFYWSPEPPEHYVIQHEGNTVGLGAIAWQNYAAFNLAWGNALEWESLESQKNLVVQFSKYRNFTSYKMGEQTVGDWVCMLQPQAFIKQLHLTPTEVPSIARELLGIADRALNKSIKHDV